MARNPVQFQKGLSLADFTQRYGSEEQCHEALVEMRWPDGFACPKCGGREHATCKPRKLFQCRACRKQTSVRAGTVFEKSPTPLTKWFLAIHLMTSAKNDIAALELARQLGVKWDTAWLIKQKLMQVMAERNATYKLKGRVQVDDAYQGGEQPAKPGKTGRAAAHKTPFLIAVETHEGRPAYTHLRCVPGFTKEAIRDYAKANLAPGTRVRSDGLSCWPGVAEAGMTHSPRVTGGGRPKDDDGFKWVNIGLGNLKSAIKGTLRSMDAHHTPRYLAAFEWRYNRRFDLSANVERLARVAVATAPHPYRTLAQVRPRPADLVG